MTLSELFSRIANELRLKLETTGKITASDFPDKIAEISKGVDTSDATATAEDILINKTAYVNGEKLTGSMPVNNCNAVVTTIGGGTSSRSFLDNYITEIKNAKCNNGGYTFYNLKKLESVELDTTDVTSMRYMFNGCTGLKKVSQLDASKVTTVEGMFFTKGMILEEFDGLLNYGKVFTQKAANYVYYMLELQQCTLLTHESLMNVINGLYDLNLTYNVAGGGTLYTQSIVLGSTNLAKLTAEEIAIATNKGWTVS